MMRILLVLLALGLAGPVWAADQYQSCAAGFEAGTALTGDQLVLRPTGRRAICYDTNGTQDATEVLHVGDCDYIDVQVFNLTDASTDIAVQARVCGQPTLSTTTCTVMTNTTLDGNPATDTAQVAGHPALYVFPDIVTNTTTDNLRTVFICGRK